MPSCGRRSSQREGDADGNHWRCAPKMRTEMHAQKAALIKWMFLFFTGSALANVLLK